MGDRRLSPRYFDNSKALVATKYGPIAGTYLKPGETLPDDLEYRTRLSMWMSRRAVYADAFTPTPQHDSAGEGNEWMDLDRGYQVEASANGWYVITAEGATDPEAEGEKVHGIEATQDRVEDLRQALQNNGVTIEGGAGGWYTVKAPWLAEATKVQGVDAAGAERDRLALAGPPEGWSTGDEPLTPEQIANPQQSGDDGERELEPVEGPAASVIVSIDGDTYTVTAPWLDAPETFDNADAAAERQAAIRAEGPPEGWEPPVADPVTVEPGLVGGEAEGQFVVSAPWLADPEVLDSEDAANARATELREAGPPEGWTPEVLTAEGATDSEA